MTGLRRFLSGLIAGLLGLLCALPVLAMAPLTTHEMALVADEVKRMINTQEEYVPEFQIKEATPERIDRLLSMPDFFKEDQTFKVNALILAGNGKVLSFNKPSDILIKMERWFPDEFKASRQLDKQGQVSTSFPLSLYGPFRDWHEEPAAFYTLWHCMPVYAWRFPDLNPFGKQYDNWNSGRSIAVFNQGLTFRSCVDTPIDRGSRYLHPDFKFKTGVNVEALIASKFDTYLQTHACEGTGPDDCVLLMLLWAGLQPEDVRLAKQLQSLAGAASQPVMSGQEPRSSYTGEDEALRQFGLLKARLASVLAAPDAWPAGSLVSLLHVLSERYGMHIQVQLHSQLHTLNHNANQLADPWSLLSDVKLYANPSVADAVLQEMTDLPEDKHCSIYAKWFEALPPSIKPVFTEKVIKQMGRSRRCAQRVH